MSSSFPALAGVVQRGALLTAVTPPKETLGSFRWAESNSFPLAFQLREPDLAIAKEGEWWDTLQELGGKWGTGRKSGSAACPSQKGHL